MARALFKLQKELMCAVARVRYSKSYDVPEYDEYNDYRPYQRYPYYRQYPHHQRYPYYRPYPHNAPNTIYA
jgi:hypothetical protein